MLRLSSNATLFFKMFVPIFWTTIMLGMTLVVWFTDENTFGSVDLTSLRWGMLFTLLVGAASFYFILWPLKRVETDLEDVFVSNYFRTAHYNLSRDVEAIHRSRFLFLNVCTLELNGSGSFGRRMRFLGLSSALQTLRERRPDVFT